MAKIENIISKERHLLQEVIPLKTPYVINIDPSNLCNFNCEFCAAQSKTDNLPFAKQTLDLELYKKAIDDMTQFEDTLKVLRLAANGEPLVNKNLPEMIKYAKEKKVANFIETVTNGSLLSPKLNQKLIDSGIDRIRISIEALDSEGYAKIAGRKIDFEELLANIKDLHDRSGDCEIYCKIVDIAVPEESEKERFYTLFNEICDKCFIDNVIPLWSDFDKIKLPTQGVHGQQVKRINICPYPFYTLMVNVDGEVTVCCADWKRKVVVGDIKVQSLKEIWNGEKLRNFWIDMLKGNKNKYESCRKCILPSFDCNDDIDEYGEVILQRMNYK